MIPRFVRLILLGPLAALHGAVLMGRHALYDLGILPSTEGAIPTLVLGNLTVGGTGKTPMTERVVRDMESILGTGTVGVLSRGYGRKTRGYIWVKGDANAAEVGDEPLMLARKLPHAPIAVCENRLKGLQQMKAGHPDLKWVVCDDALQHRRLKPTLSLLLIDSTQPVHTDTLLPLGRLRDVRNRMRTADAVVVTRLSHDSTQIREAFARGLPDDRPVFGSRMQSEPLRSWPDDVPCKNGNPGESPDRRERILAVAGIARPERFMDRLAERFQVVRREAFADHKSFSAADFKRWSRIIEADRLHAVVTTEKDAMRLPKTGVDGVPIRYEPMKAEWSNSSHFQAWLAKQLQDDTRSTVQNR